MEDARGEPREEDDDRLLGTRLGAFRIESRLGRGGMGVVYRAIDERLDRAVALKVLPPGAVEDTRGRSRLLREARAASAVTHPNLAAIYEVGDADGLLFLAMELVTGRTLRERLSEGPLPVTEALRITRGVAAGVAKAHEAGIVHRDLKPENVIVMPDGAVKVLDFGIAKPIVAPAAVSAEADTVSGTVLRFGEAAVGPDRRAVVTQEGEIVGTPPYMAPEQIRGAPLDARVDVFALGAILHELLVGQRAFDGPTVADVLAKVLLFEPESPSRTRPAVPARLDRIVMRCLAKDPGARYPDAAALGAALDREIERRPSGPSRRGLVPIAVGIGLAAVGAAAVAGTVWLSSAPDSRPQPPSAEAAARRDPTRRQLTAFPSEVAIHDVALSRDGLEVAYADPTSLHVRSVGSDRVREIPNEAGWTIVEMAFFPDGRRLLAAERGPGGGARLVAIALADGARTLLRSGVVTSIAPSPDGRRIAFRENHTMFVADASGRSARPVLSTRIPFSPVAWSPDGRWLAFAEPSPHRIVAVRDDGSSPHTVVSNPRLLQESGTIIFRWLADGRLVYALGTSPPDPPGTVIWEVEVDAEAAARGRPVERSRFEGVAVASLSASGDGTRVALVAVRTQTDVFVAGLSAGGDALVEPRRLTLDDRNDRISGWLADSRTVLFSSDRAGPYAPYRQPIDAPEAERIPSEAGVITWPIAGPDPRSLLYFHFDPPAGPGTVAATLRSAPLAGPPSRVVRSMRSADSVSAGGRPPPLRTSFTCSARGRCVMAELVDHDVVISEVALDDGRAREVLRFDGTRAGGLAHGVALSPDGERVVVPLMGSVDVWPLGGGEPEVVVADPTLRFQYAAWDPLGRGIYVSALLDDRADYRLLFVDRDGRRHTLRSSETTWLAHPTPSPDGRHLAYCEKPFDADIWLLDGF
jgi:serine/threonine protein kinase/Tol biopolymer transport system component